MIVLSRKHKTCQEVECLVGLKTISPGYMSDKMPEYMSNRMTNRMPEYLSDNMPEYKIIS